MIRIGTRGSALALAQARWVAERLPEPTELVTVPTSTEENDKARWVSGLERALLAGEIEIAVHSAKDVPAELAPGLELAAIPRREDPRDAICGADALEGLAQGARVGTSSLRRTAQLRALREDVEVVEIRGNVDTRLRKLAAGEVDALVLAAAGLRRLGLQPDGILDQLVPAAGQGALAIEARAGLALARSVNDPATATCVAAERELTRALDASCNTPVGAHARLLETGELELCAWVGKPDGSGWLSDRVCGGPDGIGRLVAERMLGAGAAEMLGETELRTGAEPAR